MKYSKMILVLLVIFFAGLFTVKASEARNINNYIDEVQLFSLTDKNPSVTLCHEANVLKAFKIVAYFIVVIKILVPIVLIVTGIYSLFKAVLNSDDSAIKKAVNLFITKFIVGAFIFFIPTIIGAIMNLASGYDKTKNKFSECGKCMNSIKTCDKLIATYSK